MDFQQKLKKKFCFRFFFRDFFFAQVLTWSAKSPKLPLKTNPFIYLIFVFLIEKKSRILIFVSIEFSNANAIFEFRFPFLLLKLNFWICIKTVSKNDIYFRPRVFFSTSCHKGLSKGFLIEKDIVSSFSCPIHSYHTNG